MTFKLPLFLFLLLCSAQTLSIKIHSVPEVNSIGVIETKLNETVSLICQTDVGHDPLVHEELVWLRNGDVVRLNEGNKEGRSSVCITPTIHEDNGATFTCHLSKNTTVNDSVTLNVTYGPQLSGSEDIVTEEEALLLLQCNIRANPPVSYVSWTLNGNEVDLEASGFTVTTDGFETQLSAQKAKRGLHDGTYQCVATSPLYGVHTKLFFVSLTDMTIKFPLIPMIAGLVVVGLTMLLAVIARWKKIIKDARSAAKFKQSKKGSSSTGSSSRGQKESSSAVSMASSVMDGVGRAVVGVWRQHTVLDESDGAESSPEVPDHFRKLRSSSSLNSLRMSMRKRLPLRSIQANSLPENPTWETSKEQSQPSAVHKLTRSARNSINGVYQKLQRTREFSHEECLVETPGRTCDEEDSGVSTSRTPRRTPGRAATPRRTPRSTAKTGRTPKSQGRRTPEAGVRGVKTGGGRRQLVRMAALRSPFASPNTQNQRLKFDQDLESVSSGLKRLKRLSKAFDNMIGRDDRASMREHSGGAVMRKLDPSGKLSRSNLTRRASQISDTLGGWANTAVNTIRKPN
ncbi:transmembrane and immunoglobulin domain-containing protein 1 [Antennarius striatus]|uniref:transmembrane and immunoglobulin domain-containing protein 1 n=1 Tax=Antennarius striatus TaxID=241820 RepID=UPI0035AFDEF0